MNQTLKFLILMVTVSLLFLFSSCDMSLKTDTPYSLSQISEAVISSQPNISAMQPLFPDDDYFNEYLSNIYQLNADDIKDGAIYYTDGMLADEIAVLLLKDNSNIRDIEAALTSYKENRQSVFLGYAPKQADILERSIITSQGDYVALLICENSQKAESVFKACFSSNLPEIREDIKLALPESEENSSSGDPDNQEDIKLALPESEENSSSGDPDNQEDIKLALPESMENSSSGDPDNQEDIKLALPESVENSSNGDLDNQEDVYDSDAILKAWRSGDKTSLSSKNLSILDACSEIINAIISEDMSDYEKELTIHDWIIDHTDYDEEANSNSPDAKPDPDNDNPYGAIIKNKAICSGYSSTFQLFMDLLDIECITVNGSTTNGDEHAWNMVQIDGNWYCVDVTWDDPTGIEQSASEKHEYFNVTNQFMRETNHVWNESTTPIADSEKLYNLRFKTTKKTSLNDPFYISFRIFDQI